MPQLSITGQTALHGTLAVAGRKNAALKLIAASLLSDRPVRLERVPEIGDVLTMLKILESMGSTYSFDRESGVLTIDTSGVTSPVIPSDLGRRLRASLVLVGPLLARFKEATFPHPGGCVIGKRSIAPHLAAFKELGAEIDFDGTEYRISAARLEGRLVYLKEKSVTGTENLVMAAVGALGTTTILNAAEESHIVNLCDFLCDLGYRIRGAGSSSIVVEGDGALQSREASARIIPDEIEVGTFAVAAALTGGDVTLTGTGSRLQLLPLLSKLDDFSVNYQYDEAAESLRVLPGGRLTASTVQVNPWPGFPPDLQSPFTVLATQAEGTSLIHDWMYEGRLYFVDLLQKMGANIVICDPHRALVSGPTPLYRSSSITPDLRAGAALILAALIAEGTSVIEHAELIDRGYVRIDERLRQLGAQITRE